MRSTDTNSTGVQYPTAEEQLNLMVCLESTADAEIYYQT